MKNVRTLAEEIVTREGGYVDDPADPGGPTNLGVTLQTLRRLGIDKTENGVIDQRDLHALSREDAAEIFIEHYYTRPRIMDLPEVLRPGVFDMYVNAGVNAIKILQTMLNKLGPPVTVDGMIGPCTIEASHRAEAIAPDHLADAYAIARRNYYFRLADRRPASRKFARTQAGGKGGWIIRAESFMDARYHLSAEQFQARVAAWG